MKTRTYIFIFILCVASFLRLYKLDSIPPGLSQDETSLGYNAYSILTTGKDEHGATMPQNFKAFGEYKLPGYIYLSTLPIAIFGTTPLAIRLPAAVFGILTVVLLYFLVKEFIPHTHATLPLFSMSLLAINPWHLQLSRGAFEVTVALFFFTAAVLLWLVAKKRSSAVIIGFSITAFALSGYTYNIARLLGPLSILLLICMSYPMFKKFRINSWIIIVLFGLCAFGPMVLGMLGKGGLSSTGGTMIWSSAYVQAPLLEWRSYFSFWPTFITKILLNQFVLTVFQFVHNFISFFSPTFFFVTGSLHGNHGIGTAGQWYVFEALTILLGIISTTKRKLHPFVWFWILATASVVALTRESPHATRAFFVVIPVTILSAAGMLSIITSISQIKITVVKIMVFFFLLSFCSYQIFSYFASYYVRFPIAYAKPWRRADKEASLYLKAHEREYTKIIIDDTSGFMYSSLLYYVPIDPVHFQRDAIWRPDDSEGFSFPIQFGKYEFRSIDWTRDLQNPKTLILTNRNQAPQIAQTIQEFHYPTRPVVIAVGQQILQYPVTDPGYVFITKR